jgi:hypothetical protein
MSIFLVIPEYKSSAKYYIKPIDIINLREDTKTTLVSYRYGTKEASITTALTGKDIHEQMVKMEEEAFNFITFGDGE